MIKIRYQELQNNLKPAVPYIYLYDKNGGQAFTNAGQFHTWDTTKIKTSHFQYTSDKDKITLSVNASGYYLIEFDCSYAGYIAAYIRILSSVYKNDAEVECTRSYCGIYSLEQKPELYACQTIHTVIFLEKGDNIKIHTITNNAGNTYSLTETSRLIISFIPMKGWNNSAGGRGDFKGGVMR